MMAQNFHWNVTGMSFGALHTLFQTIYEDHFVAQDEIAERVRALGAAAEGTLAAMLERSAVKEVPGKPSDKQMLLALAEAQEAITATLARTAATAAEHGDPLTEDLCIARGQAHEKFTWMLRAHLS
jgi:starvation-inducible DNA-binding protein